MAIIDGCSKEEESARALLEMKGISTSQSRRSSYDRTNVTLPDMRNSLANILNNPLPSFSHSSSFQFSKRIDTQSARYTGAYRDSGLVTPDEPADSEFDKTGQQSSTRRASVTEPAQRHSDGASYSSRPSAQSPTLPHSSQMHTPPYAMPDSPPQTSRSVVTPQFPRQSLSYEAVTSDEDPSKRRKTNHISLSGPESFHNLDESHTRGMTNRQQNSQFVQQHQGWSAITDPLPALRPNKDRLKRKREVEPQQAKLELWDLGSQSLPSSGSSVNGAEPTHKGVSGVFQKHEIEALTNFMQRYCKENNITQFELNGRIQETNRSIHNRFWAEVTAVLPYRTRQSIYKVCRRRFHNYGVRGKWTPAEDETLKAAQAEKPNQWKAIGVMINRMPEDCRDRWRNYLKCGDNRQQDVWTEQEERMLREAVEKCFHRLRTDPSFAKRSTVSTLLSSPETQQDDKLLNWTFISEEMGGVRSRLQCQYKWPKLKKRDLENERARAEARDRLARGLPAEEVTKKTWRTKRSELNYTKMLTGDKLDLLHILNETGTIDEQNIPWKLVGKTDFCKGDRWSISDCKTAYRKMKEDFNITAPVNKLGDIIILLQDQLAVKHPNELYDRYVHPVVEPKSRTTKTISDRPQLTRQDSNRSDSTFVTANSDDSDLRYINNELDC